MPKNYWIRRRFLSFRWYSYHWVIKFHIMFIRSNWSDNIKAISFNTRTYKRIAELTEKPLFINFETEIKLRLEFRTYNTSGRTNVQLFRNFKTTTPIATVEIVALDAKVNLISPSWHCLVDLNPYNVLQIWLVTPKSMHQVFKVSVI